MEGLWLAGIAKESIVDGPGLRYTIFTQGCPHHCVGCHNPATWPKEGGTYHTTAQIIEEFDKNPLLCGITFSGGEPLLQPAGLLELAALIKERPGKNIVCYTGYVFEDLLAQCQTNIILKELLEQVDILIDGPFVEELRDISLSFCGSQNQRYLDMKQSLQYKMAVIIPEI